MLYILQGMVCPNVSCSVTGVPPGECCTTCGEWVCVSNHIVT